MTFGPFPVSKHSYVSLSGFGRSRRGFSWCMKCTGRVKSYLRQRFFLLIGILVLILVCLDNAQGAGLFNADSEITLRVDSITNLTNPGSPGLLGISGEFFLDQSGSYELLTGDGFNQVEYSGGSLASPVFAGNALAQRFSLSGSAANGSAEAFYSALGDLVFNNATPDDYEVQLSLLYELSADASGGTVSEVTASLNFSDDLGAYDGYQEAFASSFGPASNRLSNLSAPDSFILTIAAFGSDTFYSDVSLSAYTEATVVPLPAAAWLMIAGIASVARFAKRWLR